MNEQKNNQNNFGTEIPNYDSTNQFNMQVGPNNLNNQPINNNGSIVGEINNNQQSQTNFNQQIPNYNTNNYQNGQPTNPIAQSNDNNNNKQTKNKIPVIIGIVAVVAIVILLVVFGGNKTLVCTTSETSMGIEMNTKATMKFSRNKAKSLDAVITVNLGRYADQKHLFIEQFERTYASYDNETMDINITSDDENVYINMNAKKGNFSGIGITNTVTYEEAKKELEDEGFICE